VIRITTGVGNYRNEWKKDFWTTKIIGYAKNISAN